MNRFNSLMLAVALSGLAAASVSAQAPSTSTPGRVVFITVDAMRPDYVTRFASQLTGGLGRLYRGGAFFTNAFQDHAITETAQGNSATMSGRFHVDEGISASNEGVIGHADTFINVD